MKSSSSALSPPPSPVPVPVPLPVSSSAALLHCCPELDLSVQLSPAKPPKKSQPRDPSGLKGRRASRKGGARVNVEEPPVVTVTPEMQIQPQQPVRAQRNSRGHRDALRQWAEPPAVTSNEDPCCLQRMELNTTLALRAKLQSLQGAEFDSHRAVRETLQNSERTKNLINAKASEVVNLSHSQLLYTSLVSIDVEKDQLISQVLRDKLMLAPNPRCHGNKTAEGPSLSPFLTSDLFRQKPFQPEETAIIKPYITTRHAHSTFDLFRRQRRYEATP
ncbi:protein phosphatase 1 regulatory subunit 35 [Brachionichthys hirsutus]|uniref:protein phosphatase 1 regulatory subunit 35 n=1 Tax=Brachionichthys hirsutus TaxID=412623 RepID=UPI003604387D